MEQITLDEYKQALLDVFKSFSAFCDKHQLNWYACAGTAIGAVRHNGFIPWDDDIDLYMPKDDYLRFLTLTADEGYEIVYWDREGYYLPFAKYCDAKTTLIEYEHLPLVLGAYIDIFPLYELPNLDNMEQIRKQRAEREFLVDVYGRSFANHKFRGIWRNILQGNIKPVCTKILDMILHRWLRKYYKQRYAELERGIAQVAGDEYYWDYGCGFALEKTLFKKSWFLEYLEFPFEDTIMRMPIGYDELLSYQYGDYMTPPPEDKRVSTHNRCYVNLKERLTREEVQRRLAQEAKG